MSCIALRPLLVKLACRYAYGMLEIANLRKSEVEGEKYAYKQQKSWEPNGAAKITIDEN